MKRNIREIADLLYDKLADNDQNETFETAMVDNMCLVFENGTAKIGFIIGGVEYVLTLAEHKAGEFEIFENENREGLNV